MSKNEGSHGPHGPWAQKPELHQESLKVMKTKFLLINETDARRNSSKV